MIESPLIIIEHSPTIVEFAKAFVAAQGEMTSAVKDRKNDHFKSTYATLDAVIESARPPLRANGLSFIQAPGKIGDDNMLPVMTMLLHISGEWMKATLYVPIRDRTAQGVGSAITYAKRYSLQSMLGIAAADDDDAEAAMGRGEPAKANGNGARKSSAQAKRDGDWERFTGELNNCTSPGDVWNWFDLRQGEISNMPVAWREQIHEYADKKLNELCAPIVEQAKAMLKKGAHADAVEKIAKGQEFKTLVADLSETPKKELLAFYRNLVADLTADQVAA